MPDVLAEETDAAGLGPVESRDGVEQGFFAGAVGADDGGDGAGGDLERHVIEGFHAAERQSDPLDFKDRIGECRHR